MAQDAPGMHTFGISKIAGHPSKNNWGRINGRTHPLIEMQWGI